MFFGRKLRIGLAAFISMFCAQSIFASDIRLYGETNEYSLISNFKILEDADHKYNIEDISGPIGDERFLEFKSSETVKGYSTNSWWLKFDIENVNSVYSEWYMDFVNPHFTKLDSYLFKNGKMLSQRSHGIESENVQTERRMRPYVRLNINPGDRITVYIHVVSIRFVSFEINLTNKETHDSSNTMFLAAQGIYFGVMGCVGLLAMAMFVCFGAVSFLFYLIYIANVAIFALVVQGIFDALLFLPGKVLLLSYCESIGMFLAATGLLAARPILQTSVLMPRLDRFVLQALSLHVCFAFLQLMDLVDWVYYQDIANVASVFLLLLLGGVAVARGSNAAKVFMLGWLVFAGSVIYWTLARVGLLEINAFTSQVPLYGSLGEVLFMSIALGVAVRETNAEASLVREKEEHGVVVHELLHVLCDDIKDNIRLVINSCAVVDEQSSRDWNKVKRSANIINDIVDDVKGLASSNDGNTYASESVPVRFLLDNAMFVFQQKLAQKDISLIDISASQDLELKIRGNRTILANDVLNNIISNAIKFTHFGGEIRVKARMGDGFVELIVEDDGVGIPPSILKNIFCFDYKTSRIGTDGERGTGFGMPLVKKFIDEFGGEIDISSSPNKTVNSKAGTKVKILLPQYVASKE